MRKDSMVFIFGILAILMVGILIGGLYYDRNSAVLDRTLDYDITDINEDAKLISMNKHGSIFDRKQYEARIRFPNTPDNQRDAVNKLVEIYKFPGAFLTVEDYQNFKSEVLSGYKMKPKPIERANEYIWCQGVELSGGHTIYHIMCEESSEYCYLYIYYSK